MAITRSAFLDVMRGPVTNDTVEAALARLGSGLADLCDSNRETVFAWAAERDAMGSVHAYFADLSEHARGYATDALTERARAAQLNMPAAAFAAWLGVHVANDCPLEPEDYA